MNWLFTRFGCRPIVQLGSKHQKLHLVGAQGSSNLLGFSLAARQRTGRVCLWLHT